METNKFFKTLWRINALLIFIAGSAAAIFTLMGLGLMASEFGPNNEPPPPAEVTAATNAPEDEKFRLTIPYSDRTVGQYTYIELQAGERTYSKFSSGRSDRQLRNIAVFDMKANTTKWIFPNSAQDITEFKDIVKTHLDEKGKSTSITVGFLLTTEASRADRSISRDLWIMRPNGEGLRTILSDLTGDIEFKKFGKNEHRLIVETEDEILVYPFDNVSLTLGEATKISMP